MVPRGAFLQETPISVEKCISLLLRLRLAEQILCLTKLGFNLVEFVFL